MSNDKLMQATWIEAFVLKDKSKSHFSFFNNVITVFICSLLLILSAKIKVDLYLVPITLQPLAILMISMLCGRNLAFASISLYLFQGMVGLPVFANGGGLMYFIGPTGGFLIGFLLAGVIIGELADRGWGLKYFTSMAAMLIGLCVIYLIGIFQLCLYKSGIFNVVIESLSNTEVVYLILTQYANHLPETYIIMKPYIIGDFYKLILATLLLPQIWKLVKKSK